MTGSSTPNNARVVVVEDDSALASVLQELLTFEGYHVFTHHRAAGAARLVREVRPQVVLLDLRLAGDAHPEGSGWQVLDELVLDPVTRDIPVVVSSGMPGAIEARRPALLPEHGVRVLIKPYDLDQLLATLGEASVFPEPCPSKLRVSSRMRIARGMNVSFQARPAPTRLGWILPGAADD
jgi:CheY-like chemotaxis protein